MTIRTNLTFLAIPILLLLLTALAGYAYSQITTLSLPIPKTLALFTVFLPLVTGLATQNVKGLIRRPSKNEPYQLTIPFIAVVGFQLIYETVIATLALVYMIPPSSLTCGLETNWEQLYKTKDVEGIRAIQDALKCCGFRTVKDRAFPFGAPSTCAKDFGRTKSCLAPWRQAEQKTAGWLLLVAIVIFVVKALAIILLTRSPWYASRWARSFLPSHNGAIEEAEEDHRAVTRGLIEDGAGDERYHDDAPNQPSESQALESAANGGSDNRPRVQPSQLIDAGNEWRSEGEEQHP